MKKSIIDTLGIAVIAALLCVTCSDSGLETSPNNDGDAARFLDRINCSTNPSSVGCPEYCPPTQPGCPGYVDPNPSCPSTQPGCPGYNECLANPNLPQCQPDPCVANPNAPGCTTPIVGEPVWVPVTFYDFHSDRSNPEFEQPHGKTNSGYGSNGLWRGMVAPTLDAEKKPQRGSDNAVSALTRSYGVAQWFRDWNTYVDGAYSKGKYTIPSYEPSPGIRQDYNNEWGATVSYTGDAVVDYDTAFINRVIRDSLEFTFDRTSGMYEFDRRGNNAFFPLNGRGFGNEWAHTPPSSGANTRNFAFTMEMEYLFTAQSNMVFNFAGDDDVWVFIDDNLALDLGGIHSELTDDFRLDAVLSADQMGKRHFLRVFYAERHSSASNIRIQTNIVAAR